MHISSQTNILISAVQAFSGNQLVHADDCALLAETAALSGMDVALAELCFTAKFLHKTFQLMKRIGPMGEGYDSLSTEFESNISKARELMNRIAEAMPDEDRERFSRTYLALAGPAFGAMMELVRDLNWMKNYSLDQKA